MNWMNGTTDCGGTVSGSDLCVAAVHYNPGALWLLLVLYLVVSTIGRITANLLKASVLVIVQTAGTDFGFQASWSLLGNAMMPPLTGVLADMNAGPDGQPDFRMGFYLAMAFGVATASIGTMLPIKKKMPARNVGKNLKKLLSTPIFASILMIQFWNGVFNGYLNRYLLLFLDEVLAPATLMGIIVAVGCMSGLFFYIFSGSIIRSFGYANIIILGILLLCARFVGYSYLYLPYLAIPLQALDGVTRYLVDVCVLTFISNVTPPDVFMSAQGLAQGVQEGPGKGVGILTGGLLTSYLGSRFTFRVMAIAAAAVGTFYLVVNCICLRMMHHKDQIDPEQYEPLSGKKLKDVQFDSEREPLLAKSNAFQSQVQKDEVKIITQVQP